MELMEIEATLKSGSNLFYALTSVYMVERLDETRPAKKVVLVNIETGAKIWVAPSQVHHVVGKIDDPQMLPYNLAYKILSRREKIVEAKDPYNGWPLPVKVSGGDGSWYTLLPGDMVHLRGGVKGIYIGETKHHGHAVKMEGTRKVIGVPDTAFLACTLRSKPSYESERLI